MAYTVGSIQVPFIMDMTRPDASSTGLAVEGLSVGGLTVHSGDWNITTNGTVIDGYLVTGLMYITGNNVTVRNCKFVSRTVTSSPRYAVIQSQGTGTVIENCDISCYDDTQNPAVDNTTYIIDAGVKVTAGTTTVSRCNIHDVTDTVYLSGGTVEVAGCYLHSPCLRTDDANQSGSSPPYYGHTDAVQVMGGSSHNLHGNNIDMRYSTVTGAYDGTQAIQNCHGMLLQASSTAVTGLLINYNWFAYGDICMLFSSPSVSGSDATLAGNRVTPNQEIEFSAYKQIQNNPRAAWTLTGVGTTVYSDDSDTPEAWRGVAIKASVLWASGTQETWLFDQYNHTP